MFRKWHTRKGHTAFGVVKHGRPVCTLFCVHIRDEKKYEVVQIKISDLNSVPELFSGLSEIVQTGYWFYIPSETFESCSPSEQNWLKDFVQKHIDLSPHEWVKFNKLVTAYIKSGKSLPYVGARYDLWRYLEETHGTVPGEGYEYGNPRTVWLERSTWGF